MFPANISRSLFLLLLQVSRPVIRASRPSAYLAAIKHLLPECALSYIALHRSRPINIPLPHLFFPLFKHTSVFNIACSRAQTTTQMLVFRFFAGLGGSAPLAIGGGTISDLFPPEQRGCVCLQHVSYLDVISRPNSFYRSPPCHFIRTSFQSYVLIFFLFLATRYP